jgi:transcriptional regulator with XRE-family HTH domain
MVDRTRWREWVNDARSSADYAADQLKLDFAVDLERRMDQLGISRADLARRLQTSAAAVTMALRGDANLTIERMVRMARALDATVHIHVAPASAAVRWFDVIAQRKQPVEHASMWARSSGHG